MSSFESTLASSNVLITCGPGGIGKTTCAAALAVELAHRRDQRVLVVTVDPARRLADALGVSAIGNDPTVIGPVDGRGELSVAMLDMKASWDALIVRHAPDENTAQQILDNQLYRNITSRFIQSHDYIAMERLHEFVEADRYDLIVVDTPPTRNALDFLDAPTRMADFFSSRLLRWIIAPTRGGVAAVAAKPFAAVADRILGGQFLSDITEFFRLLNSMHEGFVLRAREVETLLAARETAFVVISSLEAVPLGEAEFFVEELKRREFAVRGLVVNRVLPSSLRSDLDSALDALATESVDDEVEPATAARVRDAMVATTREWSLAARREAETLARLARRDGLVVAVPSLDGEIAELGGVRALGQLLLDAEPVVESPA